MCPWLPAWRLLDSSTVNLSHWPPSLIVTSADSPRVDHKFQLMTGFHEVSPPARLIAINGVR
eukprot:2321949-Amphidinium_carterae.1